VSLILHHACIHTLVEISFLLLINIIIMNLLRCFISLVKVISKYHVVHLPLSEEIRFLRILWLIVKHRWHDLNRINFLMPYLSSCWSQTLIKRIIWTIIWVWQVVTRIFEKRWIELFYCEATRIREIAVSLLLICSSIRTTSVEEVCKMATCSIFCTNLIPF